MTQWKFMMRCPAGKHLFDVEPDTILRIPDVCPGCAKSQAHMSWWKQRKLLKKFQSELERFRIDPE